MFSEKSRRWQGDVDFLQGTLESSAVHLDQQASWPTWFQTGRTSWQGPRTGRVEQSAHLRRRWNGQIQIMLRLFSAIHVFLALFIGNSWCRFISTLSVSFVDLRRRSVHWWRCGHETSFPAVQIQFHKPYVIRPGFIPGISVDVCCGQWRRQSLGSTGLHLARQVKPKICNTEWRCFQASNRGFTRGKVYKTNRILLAFNFRPAFPQKVDAHTWTSRLGFLSILPQMLEERSHGGI